MAKKQFNEILKYMRSGSFHHGLIEKTTNVDTLGFDRDGRTLLFHAVLLKSPDYVRLFLESGAGFDRPDKIGWYPLHYAAQDYLIDIARTLLENGANVNAIDSYGNTVIWRAVFSSEEQGEMIGLLKRYGADPHIKNHSGVSALDLANTIANYDNKQFL